MDISILQKEPVLNTKVEIRIRPLAPLSMVADFPGSYYKTMYYPTKKMFSGLFENILGWHFDLKTRTAIIKDVNKQRNKQKKNIDVKDFVRGSSYQPLLMEYFELEGNPKVDNLKSMCSYDDYWSKSYRRSDSFMHINGSRYMGASIILQYRSFIKEIDNDNSLSSSELKAKKDAWFKKNVGAFPLYYSTPTKREFVHIDGVMSYVLIMDSDLADLLLEQTDNIGYLGTNEGWIDINIRKHD